MLSSPTLTYTCLRRLLAACAFFICLSSAAQAQTQFSGTPQTIDNGVNDGGVGQYDSQAIVNGNPAISYYDATNRNLKYIRANDAEGTSWGTPVIVDAPGDVGQWTSLEIVNGFPAISYYDVTNTNLKYARALDTDGATWGAPITINPPGNVGTSSSLEMVNGRPAISYYDAINQDLLYIRATEADGTTLPWETPVTIESAGNTGVHGSLEVVAGNPAIAYYKATGTSLKYVRATDTDGTGWGLPVTVTSGGTIGQNPSLAVVNGNPAISFHNTSAFTLRYVRATSTDGSTWAGSITLDTASTGGNSSLAVVNGNPAISYKDSTNTNLKYVRANDANGATAAAWGPRITIDSDGSVGSVPSLVIAAGNPAVSYWDAGNGNLKYIRASGANGTSWNAPFTIDVGSGGNVGQWTSLAVVNGKPAVSYYDVTEQNLRYVRALDASGTQWETPIIVDSVGNVGLLTTSLKVINGNPAISYYDGTNGNLKYVRATDADGTSWGIPVTIDSIGNVGQYTSLDVVDGNPAISYHDTTLDDVKYVRATDINGTGWDTPLTLDSDGIVGAHTSLTIVSGNPAISYRDNTNLTLKYIRATDTTGAIWGKPLTITPTGNDGYYTPLLIVNGKPAIGYYHTPDSSLRYVRATDADGTSWEPPLTIASSGIVGQYASLEIINGKPAISYYDATNGNLRYVRATDADGADWGSSFMIDATGTVGQYTSLAAINCSAAVSYYNATNGDLKYVRSSPVWNGELSADWHTGTNWVFGCVPADGENVALPDSGVITEAVISNGDVIVGDLTLGTNRTVTVSGNRTLTVTGVLSMNGGMITVEPGSRIIFGCNASVTGASATDFIAGPVMKEFCDAETFAFPVGEITGTAEYSPMTAEITAGTFPPTAGTPPSLTVSVTDTWLPGLVQSGAVSRYWTVAEGGDLTADMTFQYLNADVNGDKDDYKVFRRSGLFTTQYIPFLNDAPGNAATAQNVNVFSDWGIGTATPTAASISIGGRVVNPQGIGVSGAQVTMVDQNGAIQLSRTSQFGYYRFDSVAAGQTYVVSVASKRYSFPVQVVTATDNVEDLDFTAK